MAGWRIPLGLLYHAPLPLASTPKGVGFAIVRCMDASESEQIDIAGIGEDVPLLEGIRTTRAIRRLRPDPVPFELIRKVCEAGTFAPSGGNRQPWYFIAVTDRERRAFIAERYRKAFERYSAEALRAAEAPDYPVGQRKILMAAKHLAEHMHEAPVQLVVAGFTRRGQEQSQALFPCIQNILLACRAVGLGASLTTVHRVYGKEIDELLGLPEKLPSCALIPIGWPLGRYGRPERKPVDQCLFVDRFDPSAIAERS
jgi:nitroreductase